MERIEYLILEITAVIIGVILFTLGYTDIKNKFQGKNSRVLWAAVAVVLAFLSVTFSRAEEPSQKDSQTNHDTEQKESLETQPEWKKFRRAWDTVTQLEDYDKTDKELEQIKKDTKETLDSLTKLTKKGLITPALIKLIGKEMENDIGQVEPKSESALFPMVTCYETSPGAFEADSVEQSFKRLKERLPLLEKIAAQGNKVNYWTYKNVILRMKKDIDTLNGKFMADEIWERLKDEKTINEETESVKNKVKDHLDALLNKIIITEKLSPQDETTVKNLIKDLGSDDWDKRELATNKLKAMVNNSPGLIPYLQEAAKSKDPEVKMRATQILKCFNKEISDSKALALAIDYLKSKGLCPDEAEVKLAEGIFKSDTGIWTLFVTFNSECIMVTIDPVKRKVLTAEKSELPQWKDIEEEEE